MKLKKFTMIALTALSMLSIAGCSTSKDSGKTTNPIVTTSDDSKVDKKYQIYLLAQESGYTGTYEEWLESIKGDSISVIVSEGKLKWKYSKEAESSYRDLIDLSVLKGEDGKTPVVTIGENGNWFIDGTDTEIRARANDGKGISTIVKTNTEGLVDTYTITFTDGTTAIFNVTNGSEGSQGATGNGVRSITKGESEGLVDTYIISFTDGSTSTFAVTNGKDGVDGAVGNGISSIVKGETVGLVDSYIITFSNGTTFTYNVTNGSNGEAGAVGNGIARVAKTGSEGLVDTYTITFTDGSTSTFTITNGSEGSQGAAGNGIESVIKTSSEGLVDTYTITFTNGDTTTFTVSNGSEGSQGATGNGIATVAKTGSEGLVDTYTITFTNGDTTTFTVTNGADGEDATSSSDIVEYTNNGLTRTSYTYNDDGSVEKIVCFYRDGQWINQSKYLTHYRTDAYADPSSPYESIEELEYKWLASEEEWKGVIGTGYEYIIEGHILKEKWTYVWSDELNDWDYSKFHIYYYDVYGNVVDDYFFKESAENGYCKYGVEHVCYDEFHSESEIYYVWNTEESEISYAKGKVHAYLYNHVGPFMEVTLYISSTDGFGFKVDSVIQQPCNLFGEPVGEPITNWTSREGNIWVYDTGNNTERASFFNVTRNYWYCFDNLSMSIIPDSYYEEVILDNCAPRYSLTNCNEYNTFNYTWDRKEYSELTLTDDKPDYATKYLYKDGVKQIVSRTYYTIDDDGKVLWEINYDYNESTEEFTIKDKWEILYENESFPRVATTLYGYNYDSENDSWSKDIKFVQLVNGEGEIYETHWYNWDPEANDGAGDWVLEW